MRIGAVSASGTSPHRGHLHRGHLRAPCATEAAGAPPAPPAPPLVSPTRGVPSLPAAAVPPPRRPRSAAAIACDTNLTTNLAAHFPADQIFHLDYLPGRRRAPRRRAGGQHLPPCHSPSVSPRWGRLRCWGRQEESLGGGHAQPHHPAAHPLQGTFFGETEARGRRLDKGCARQGFGDGCDSPKMPRAMAEDPEG